MKDYTYQDMLKMQDDALRRVREMQQMSKNVVEVNDTHDIKTKIPDKVKSISLPVEYDNINKNGRNSNISAHTSLIDYINGDSDLMIILSLIVLLGQDNADMPLILALAYILL